MSYFRSELTSVVSKAVAIGQEECSIWTLVIATPCAVALLEACIGQNMVAVQESPQLM